MVTVGRAARAGDRERVNHEKVRVLVGGELLDTEEQIIYADEFVSTESAEKDTGLVHGSKYHLTLFGGRSGRATTA